MTLRRRVAPIGVSVVAGITLTACSVSSGGMPISALENGDGYGKPVNGEPPSAAQGSGAPGNGAPVGVTRLHVNVAGTLGSVVVDNDGRTLYRYDRDRARPSASTCTGTCTRMWPPVRWTPTLRASGGVNPASVGRVRRPDGTLQLTVNGWPMYRHAQDTAPGDATGQGTSGAWFAARPNGTRAGFTQGIPVPPGYGPGGTPPAPGSVGAAPGGTIPNSTAPAPGGTGNVPNGTGNAPNGTGNAPGGTGTAPGGTGTTQGGGGSAPGGATSGGAGSGAPPGS
ncbi:hypothetical protein GCM10010191_93870 [Actinomadura vinacea]|uniref:Lipoprotein n=1 Tax=Actinomadura vinacea TaxID=115336 RepID=A0ABP5XL17_9ACTN